MTTNNKSDELSADYKDTSVEATASTIDEDELQLNRFGYKQQLHRTWHFIENFATSFVPMSPVSSLKSFIFLGLLAGGPAAIWPLYIISFLFMIITAAVIAEICSAIPISGSIYIWAAASAGPKYARFFGFLVAWWIATAWMTSAAAASQVSATYVASQLSVWEINFPGGANNVNVKWRAFIWALSEGFLVLAVAINYLPPRLYSLVLKFAVALCLLDFLLTLIWLPIGVSRTYGFRSAKQAFATTYNGTGAPAGWNWMLCFLFTASSMLGFDASGHIAEETHHANVIAARGILTSVLVSAMVGFPTIILLLFCIPDLNTLFSLDAPQPFVQVYAMALGKGPSIFMTIVSVGCFTLGTSTAIVAASRLIFAVARDGVLPFSSWISQVDKSKLPRNAVTVMFIYAAFILCTILPSEVAFTSLTSASTIPLCASYGLIALLRLFMTPDEFKWSKFKLGRSAKFFYVAAAFFMAILFAVQVSPFFFPVTGETLNFAGVILGAITIFAILSWWLIPADNWLPRERLMKVFGTIEEEPTRST